MTGSGANCFCDTPLRHETGRPGRVIGWRLIQRHGKYECLGCHARSNFRERQQGTLRLAYSVIVALEMIMVLFGSS